MRAIFSRIQSLNRCKSAFKVQLQSSKKVQSAGGSACVELVEEIFVLKFLLTKFWMTSQKESQQIILCKIRSVLYLLLIQLTFRFRLSRTDWVRIPLICYIETLSWNFIPRRFGVYVQMLNFSWVWIKRAQQRSFKFDSLFP